MENNTTVGNEDWNCSKDQLQTELLTASFVTPTSPWVYITLAVVHIVLILIPAIFCNTLAITLLAKTNNQRHPSIPIFYWICTLCVIGPCSYPLFMDMSLLTNAPFLGNCLIQWQGAIYWYGHSFFNSLLFWLLGTLSTVLYISISGGFKIRIWRLNVALVGILIFFVLETFGFIVGIEALNVESCHIRGSFCLIFYSKPTVAVVLGFMRVFIGFGIPAMVVVVTVVLTFVQIKKNAITSDKQLVQSTARLIIILLLATFFCSSPTIFFYFGSYNGFHQGFVELISTNILQLNYVLYPILIVTLHKQTREAVMSKIFPKLQRRAKRKVTPEKLQAHEQHTSSSM